MNGLMNQADCVALDLDGVISCRMRISSASTQAIPTPLKAARREHPGKGHEKWAPSLPDIFCMYLYLMGDGVGGGLGVPGWDGKDIIYWITAPPPQDKTDRNIRPT